MRKQIQSILGIMLFFAVGLICMEVEQVTAASVTSLSPSRSGQRVSSKVDLDGDGVLDTVSAYNTTYDGTYTKYIYVSVNGKTALKLDLTKECAYGFHMNIVESDAQNKCIQIYASSDNDMITFNCLYKYDVVSGQFLELLNLFQGVHRNSVNVKRATETGFVVNNRYQPMETGWIYWDYTYVWENGNIALKSTTGPVTYCIKKKFTTDRTIKFYKKPGGKKVSFTLKKGKKVKMKQVKMTKKKMYVQFQYGKKKGWIFVGRKYSQVYKHDKNYKLKQEYFKNVNQYLVG